MVVELDEIPRLRLGCYPTPLDEAPNLRSALGPDTARLWIKRDDYTGFGLGGNKVRKLEYALAPDRTEGVTCLITAGGVQSNHARVTAAAAARLGLRCILVLNGEPREPPTGNALIHRLLGAEIRLVPERADRNAGLMAAAKEVQREGGHPLVLPLGASTPLGALGYVRAARELALQIRNVVESPGRIWIFVSSSSGGTLAGLLAGLARFGPHEASVVAVSADVPGQELEHTARAMAAECTELLGWSVSPDSVDLQTTDDYVGPGYGISTEDSRAALELLARSEGIILDPVYTAKAAAGLVDWLRRKRVPAEDSVVFWHTGGFPALFE
jgi:D-cysteine desulfhydrase